MLTKEQIVEVILDVRVEEARKLISTVELGYLNFAEKVANIAAERILAMSAPVWYYPEKGELPKNLERIWIWLGDSKVQKAHYRTYPYGPSVYEAGYDTYLPHQVYAWMPDSIPTPPQL